MARVAVIGLGRFGMELARRLSAHGVEVLAIDQSQELVHEIKDDVDVAVRLDSTDKHALMSQEINRVDVCVVSIGENFEAALLTAVLARKLGVPKVICRAQTEFHADIFSQIGVDEVIQPEIAAGEILAWRLANPQLQDIISLAEGYSMIELVAPEEFYGKSLRDLQLRKKYSVNLVAIMRSTLVPGDGAPPRTVLSVPKPNDVIQKDDILVVIGADNDLSKLPHD